MKSQSILLMYGKIPVAELTQGFDVIRVLNYEKFNAIKDMDEFILDRIPSHSRRDIEQLLFSWGINDYNIHQIAIKTRLINPMDKYWLKIVADDCLEELIQKLFKDTNINYSPSGNNIKAYTWHNGRFGIRKKRLSPVISDTESEIICYHLANLFKVKCSPTEQIDEDWSFSEYVYDFNKDTFKHVRQDMPLYTGNLFEDLLRMYPDLKSDIYRMILFDFITRQDDRHRSNIAILYTESTRELYPLYDNGRSLFFEDTENFIKAAVDDIPTYATSFGEIGTYYDCIKQIPNPEQYINLDISEEDIRVCFQGLNLPDYKVEGCIKWIQGCIDILKSIKPINSDIQGFDWFE